jgi:hypothetical protein
MKFELVGIYIESQDEKYYYGTAHVFFIELGIDVRGFLVQISKKKKGKQHYVRFMMPVRLGPDYDKQEMICYPVFDIFDKEKKSAFLTEAQQMVRKEMQGFKPEYDYPAKGKPYFKGVVKVRRFEQEPLEPKPKKPFVKKSFSVPAPKGYKPA